MMGEGTNALKLAIVSSSSWASLVAVRLRYSSDRLNLIAPTGSKRLERIGGRLLRSELGFAGRFGTKVHCWPAESKESAKNGERQFSAEQPGRDFQRDWGWSSDLVF